MRAVQRRLVDRCQRGAIERLQADARGEALLLRSYLEAEERSGVEELFEELRVLAPDWLRDRLQDQAGDDARHAMLLRDRLRQLHGGRGRAPVPWVSTRRLRRLRLLTRRHAAEFRSGRVVPLLVALWRLEALSARLCAQHLDRLRRRELDVGRRHPTASLLARMLADQRRHAEGCRDALEDLVGPAERDALVALVNRVDAELDAGALTGALSLLALGWGLQAQAWLRRPGPAA